MLSAVAVAGIPGAALPQIAGLLATFGVPPEELAIINGVDRLLDMARTVLSVAADVVTACIVDDANRDPKWHRLKLALSAFGKCGDLRA